MAKLIILSVVLVSVIVPMWLAVQPSPKVKLRRAQWIVFFYIVVWAFMCTIWYPALVQPDY